MLISLINFILRLLFILFLFQLFGRVWRALTGRGSPATNQGRSGTAPSELKVGQMYRDPICGVYIAQDLALSVRSGAQTIYFCSDPCRQEYLKKK